MFSLKRKDDLIKKSCVEGSFNCVFLCRSVCKLAELNLKTTFAKLGIQ